MDFEKLANELNQATESSNIEKEDTLDVVKDSNFQSGYRVDIYWRAGTDGDGNNQIDLADLFFEDLNNSKVNAVLDKYRG
ncbi:MULTISPECIES: hypothetical protein [Lactobacillus]|uniref:Uncharacterized protein n=1 Tax=Lactobacillus xujianguonis TaxID=2495899 RepID=A0A437SU51_9LACO|nr:MULTISPECIES: hypothetical protein [Lactobacillus]RVU70414.1 hypothetical protein EJK17_07840 [Lactobacillus xujianguonis]